MSGVSGLGDGQLKELERLRAACEKSPTNMQVLAVYKDELVAAASALVAAARREEKLLGALKGTRERTLADGPCWCPDWIADDYDHRVDLEIWPHHECCVRAREVMAAAAGTDEQ